MPGCDNDRCRLSCWPCDNAPPRTARHGAVDRTGNNEGMSVRIGINGFGRVGRAVFRAALKGLPNVQIVAINDVAPASQLAQLLKYDSVYGQLDASFVANRNEFLVNRSTTRVTSCSDPASIDWRQCGVDLVIEATGSFRTSSLCGGHIRSGAKRVLLSAPALDDTPTFVFGVNHSMYRGQAIVSNASCTTNCIAVLAKVVDESFGLRRAITTTIHCPNPDQKVVDSAHPTSWRSGRSILNNIIPLSTSSAAAVGTVIPQLRGRISGVSFRVPVPIGALVDMTVELRTGTTYEELCRAMRDASRSNLHEVLGYTEDQVVASDIVSLTQSAIFDAASGMALDSHLVKIVAWYDNEVGYANRLLQMASLMGSVN